MPIGSYLYNSSVNITNCWGGLGGGAWAASELLARLLEGSGLDAVVRVSPSQHSNVVTHKQLIATAGNTLLTKRMS